MNIPAILGHLNAAGQEMHRMAVGDSLATDLRRHEAEEREQVKADAKTAAFAKHLYETSYSPKRPENFAEAMREVLFGDRAALYAEIYMGLAATDPAAACEYMAGLVAGYWANQADYEANRSA